VQEVALYRERLAMNELTLKQVYGTTTLIPVDRIIALLNQETNLEKIADFTVKVEAAKMIDKENDTRRNYWGELAIWSTRRLGELIQLGQDEGQLAKRGQPKKEKLHDATLLLADLGIEKTQSARAQKLAGLPAEKIQAYVTRQLETGAAGNASAVNQGQRRSTAMIDQHATNHVDHEPAAYVYFQRPRCVDCGSVKLRAYKSLDNLDGTRTRYAKCLDCGRRLVLVAE
jgi:hypothetical protein